MWPWTPLDFGLNIHFDINQEYPGGLAWNWLVTAILRTFFIFEQCVLARKKMKGTRTECFEIILSNVQFLSDLDLVRVMLTWVHTH